ncbi:nitronate monooxygenase [Solirubrobacter ginsenosidimutans]|uniref:Propionate 3-nitronate monooxygenase n=1 Tax=Solirubrobacter ginsenosidimutans TaxID=490573 RepID=A0A9X3MZC3_9ACTN|nr:nitronate monooxygenase [Solirubrobacter ginsenosidimutans]MDA0165580.1 nitronate monooxygenase [Solirubrobacter ginsenosidimutans]
MLFDTLGVPIVLAPMAGGPTTPELVAAVSEAGGLGFLAAGYLSADALAERIEAVRALTSRPFGVNLFVPGPPSPPSVFAAYVAGLEAEGLQVGAPLYDDDDWEAKLALLERMPAVAAVSFTFGLPDDDVLSRVRATGAEVWVTVTCPEEAYAAADVADALVVQGAEAGGHRGAWKDGPDAEPIALLALLQLIDADVPLVASGGIATRAAVQAVLALGARAAQVGTAFMRAPEAGTSDAHKLALTTSATTGLTRAFSGRLARGIHNRFMDEHTGAPIAYPEIHHATSPVRAAARKAGDADLINLWAGEAHRLAEALPAAEIVRKLSG